MFLKTPLDTLVTGYNLFAQFCFIKDVRITLFRNG